MKNKKTAFLVLFPIIVIIIASLAVFYFTRPSVCFVSDPLPKEFMGRLEKPRFLTGKWRTVTRDSYTFTDGEDVVIDMTKDGIMTEKPCIRPFYTPEELFSPLLPELAQYHITYIYDELDGDASAFRDVIEEMFPSADFIPFEYEIGRSEHGILASQLEEDTVLLVPDVYPVIDFLRSLEKPRVAVDWLDAAALETIEPEFVAAPDWESIIEDLFSENV